jgi:UDP-N-acetylglucosamine 2-epimerase (non-hydrolysing)
MDRYFDHKLLHTGQNFDYELNEIFFEDLEIRKPDYFLNAAGSSAAETIGNVIIQVDKFIDEFVPDGVLILGDTNSCLAAISAKRKKIPIFHMEAGNRCFDYRVPEEINRKIVDHISDINMTYSSIAREYLLREGFPPDQVIKTGSPMKEVLDFYKSEINNSKVLLKLSLTSKDYFVVSYHREENVDSEKNLTNLITSLNLLAERFNKKIIFSTHPRTRKKLNYLSVLINPLIQFCNPFGYMDYIKLQCEAICTLSDSGTITEESSILNFPALNLREVHERPEGFEEGAVMMVGNNFDRIIQGLEILESQRNCEIRDIKIVNDYDIVNVSLKVLRIIQSYTDFVNRKVWKNDLIY